MEASLFLKVSNETSHYIGHNEITSDATAEESLELTYLDILAKEDRSYCKIL